VVRDEQRTMNIEPRAFLGKFVFIYCIDEFYFSATTTLVCGELKHFKNIAQFVIVMHNFLPIGYNQKMLANFCKGKFHFGGQNS